jgi:hypothetical protein
MATDRAPIAYLWSTLKAFATGDVITRELLRDSINKAGDIGYGVLAALNERFQQLGSTNAGTSAVQRGSVVMGTLSFYDPVDVPVGSLDGLTLILETDLAGPVTVTFAQPTSPVHVATQINVQAAALGLVATADSGIDPNTGAVVAANVGKLLLVRPSGATADLIVYAILGLPLVDTTVSGTGTVNDGASRVGLAAFASWVGGDLRSFLVAFEAAASATAAAVATKVAKAGDTITGLLVFSGASAQIQYRLPTTLPDAASTTLTLNFDFATVPNVSQNSVYDIPNPTTPGRWFVVRRLVTGSGFAAAFRRIDTTTLGTLPDTGEGSLLFVSQSDGGSGFEWSAWPYGGAATAIA